MKLNNYGWGLREFLWLLCALALCLVIAILLYHRLVSPDKFRNETHNIFSGKTDTTIKNYIELEDKMVEAAKRYEISNKNDTVIIKLSTLITSNYINVIYDPKNNKECSGYVIYNGTSNNKTYKAYLSCAGNYQTSDYNVDFE